MVGFCMVNLQAIAAMSWVCVGLFNYHYVQV